MSWYVRASLGPGSGHPCMSWRSRHDSGIGVLGQSQRDIQRNAYDLAANLYVVEASQIHAPPASSFADPLADLRQWHHRLGHLGVKTVRAVSRIRGSEDLR
jgi:hypothetical protein